MSKHTVSASYKCLLLLILLYSGDKGYPQHQKGTECLKSQEIWVLILAHWNCVSDTYWQLLYSNIHAYKIRKMVYLCLVEVLGEIKKKSKLEALKGSKGSFVNLL